MKRLTSIILVAAALSCLLPPLSFAGSKAGWRFIEFDLVKHETERQLALNLLKAELDALYERQSDAESFYDKEFELRIFIAMEDMDGDSFPDVFALYRHPDFCGTHGCTLKLFKYTASGTQIVIPDIGVDSLAIAVGPRHHGFRDILFPGGGAGSVGDLSCPVWQHNGTAYNLKYLMAPNRWPCREATARYYNEK